MHTISTTVLCGFILAGCISSADSLQQQAIDRAIALYELDVACRAAGETPNTAAYSACLGRLDGGL